MNDTGSYYTCGERKIYNNRRWSYLQSASGSGISSRKQKYIPREVEVSNEKWATIATCNKQIRIIGGSYKWVIVSTTIDT